MIKQIYKEDNKQIKPGELTFDNNVRKVLEVRDLTPTTYVLRFERKGLEFTAGQHISLGLSSKYEAREYSLYSGENEEDLEVLIKEVEDGLVSKELKRVKEGDLLKLEGPVGFFSLKKDQINSAKYLFIASGTGIAPFHSFIKTHPNIDYKILHGVRNTSEAYEKESYADDRYVMCTSRDKKGDFHGRVTDYLKKNKIHKETQVYLCGNCDMIHDCYDILLEQGLNPDNLHSEVYF